MNDLRDAVGVVWAVGGLTRKDRGQGSGVWGQKTGEREAKRLRSGPTSAGRTFGLRSDGRQCPKGPDQTDARALKAMDERPRDLVFIGARLLDIAAPRAEFLRSLTNRRFGDEYSDSIDQHFGIIEDTVLPKPHDLPTASRQLFRVPSVSLSV
jgi:hypothetical protein